MSNTIPLHKMQRDFLFLQIANTKCLLGRLKTGGEWHVVPALMSYFPPSHDI
jgi:hypothetical protein